MSQVEVPASSGRDPDKVPFYHKVGELPGYLWRLKRDRRLEGYKCVQCERYRVPNRGPIVEVPISKFEVGTDGFGKAGTLVRKVSKVGKVR